MYIHQINEDWSKMKQMIDVPDNISFEFIIAFSVYK